MKGRWKSLDEQGMARWLREASRNHFEKLETGHLETKPSGTVFDLDGRDLTSQLAFYCALGEAINGEGGYFGWDITSMFDCAYGGFGVDPPFVVNIYHSDIARNHLSYDAAIKWVIDSKSSPEWNDPNHKNYMDKDGRDYFENLFENAKNRTGPDMLDILISQLEVRGSKVHLL